MSDRAWIVDRIGAETFERLARELSGSELQSILLDVMQDRSERRTPAEVLAQYRRDGFCRPSPVDQRTSVALDAHLFEAAVGFEAIELPPVAPFATCSAMALTDQNRVLSALRGTEVTSDPTNVLALECALRLRDAPGRAIHLTSSQRVLRAQPLPKLPGYTRHFRLFVLASGGVEARDHAFTVESVLLHVRTMLGALDRLEQHGYAFGARSVDILATAERAKLGDRIAEGLGPLARRKTLDHGYYSGGLRYMIWATTAPSAGDPGGSVVPLVDGGAFDWLAKLTSNRRAIYVASGTGAQLMALRFRAPPG